MLPAGGDGGIFRFDPLPEFCPQTLQRAEEIRGAELEQAAGTCGGAGRRCLMGVLISSAHGDAREPIPCAVGNDV